jgi:hypothetical protein
MVIRKNQMDDALIVCHCLANPRYPRSTFAPGIHILSSGSAIGTRHAFLQQPLQILGDDGQHSIDASGNDVTHKPASTNWVFSMMHPKGRVAYVASAS